MKRVGRLLGVFLLLAAVIVSATRAEHAADRKVLLDGKGEAARRLQPSSPQVSVSPSRDAGAPGVVVTIATGKENYPGVRLEPEGKPWDLSRWGHLEARVVNTGGKPLTLSLRVDNAGDWRDEPWNTESITLAPGDAGTVTTIFGFSYGRKPGFALNSAAVSGLLLFAPRPLTYGWTASRTTSGHSSQVVW